LDGYSTDSDLGTPLIVRTQKVLQILFGARHCQEFLGTQDCFQCVMVGRWACPGQADLILAATYAFSHGGYWPSAYSVKISKCQNLVRNT
jgi:hypothetical protein